MRASLKPSVEEIAQRINNYLQRFEASHETQQYYHAYAHANGGWVRITYVSYQGNHALSKLQASEYLKWLDAGNVGKHWQQQRAATSDASTGDT